MITNLDPDILECEGKWALGSITMNKASGSDRIPTELIQILYDYKAEVSNRFKGLDLTERLKNYGQMFKTLYRRQ